MSTVETRSVVICEGPSDAILLQHYLRGALGWEDADSHAQRSAIRMRQSNGGPILRSRLLVKHEQGKVHEVTLMPAGGITNIPDALGFVLDRIRNAQPDRRESYDSVLVLSDNDDSDVIPDLLGKLNDRLAEKGVHARTLALTNWETCQLTTSVGLDERFEIYYMALPPDSHGALETFLLHAIEQSDPYDAGIISRCNSFADSVDPEPRYLTSRGRKVKASFDMYFSVRTAPDQFALRRQLMTCVNWSDYEQVNETFRVFRELTRRRST